VPWPSVAPALGTADDEVAVGLADVGVAVTVAVTVAVAVVGVGVGLVLVGVGVGVGLVDVGVGVGVSVVGVGVGDAASVSDSDSDGAGSDHSGGVSDAEGRVRDGVGRLVGSPLGSDVGMPEGSDVGRPDGSRVDDGRLTPPPPPQAVSSSAAAAVVITRRARTSVSSRRGRAPLARHRGRARTDPASPAPHDARRPAQRHPDRDLRRGRPGSASNSANVRFEALETEHSHCYSRTSGARRGAARWQGGGGAGTAARGGSGMKALVKAEAAPGLWLREVPEPEAGPGEVKIRVLRTGICGTDLHVRAWDAWAASAVRTPVVLGHEIAGRVETIGPGVDTVDVGDLVSVEGHIVCGRCRWCLAGRRQLCPNTVSVGIDRDGGYAEAVVVPATNVWRHRSPIDPDVAAIFDPFGNAVHSALAFDVLAEDVLITGAGPIGIMAASVVRHAGARNVVITDMSHERLALAESMGAVTRAVDVSTTSLPDVVAELGMVEGFDVGLEMSGAPAALRSMIAAMAHGGSIALLGLPSQSVEFDWDRVIHSMLTVKGIFGREMFETWYAMSVLVDAGLDISPVITHRFPYTEFEQAFETAAGGHCGKVVIDWEAAG